jgi:uncharacterized protein (TIGR03437 family)
MANRDGSLNPQTNPARTNSLVVIYASELGQMEPPIEDGLVVPSPTPATGPYRFTTRTRSTQTPGAHFPLSLRMGHAISPA